MKFSGSHAFTGTDNITGTGTGIVEFLSGTISIGSTYDVSGATTVSGADVSVTSSATLTKLGGILTLSSGSLDLGDKSTTADGFILSGGSFNGTGTLTTATMTWSGGTLTGTGGTTAVTAALDLSGSQVLTGRTLTSSGATTLSGSGSLTGTGIFNNSGTLTKSSTGTSSISLVDGAAINFTNTGAVSVTGGTLEINLSSGSHGPYAVSTGATLRFAGSHTFADADNEIISGAGTVEFSAGTANVNSTYGPVGSTVISGVSATFTKLATNTGPFTVASSTLRFGGDHTFLVGDTITTTGTGTVEFISGTISIGTTYDVSGATRISGAAVTVSSSATLTKLGGTLTISSGSLDLGDKNTTIDAFVLSGGSFNGTGTLTTGTMNWSGGTLTGVGGTTAVTATLEMSGSQTLTGRTLTSSGTATWSGTGTLSGTGTFNNSGSLTKTTSGVSTISGITFFNTGTVSATAGTLEISLSTDSVGTYVVSNTATLKFLNGHTFDSPAAISGTDSGTIEFAVGMVAVNHTYHVTGTTKVSGADVTIAPAGLNSLGETLLISAGSLDLGSKSATIGAFSLSGGSLTGTGALTTGTLTWSGGLMSGTGTTAVTTSLDLSGDLTLTGRTLTSSVTAWSAAGSLTGTGTFTNSGILAKSSSGISSIDLLDGTTVKFTQMGAVNVTNGILALNSSTTSYGPYAVSGGATLRFTGSHDFTNAANETISGDGAVEFSAGMIHLNNAQPGGYNVTGGTSISGAAVIASSTTDLTSMGSTLTISSGSLDLGGQSTSVNTFILSSGSLIGNGGLTTGTMIWSGGSMTGTGTTAVNTALDLSGDLTLTGRTLTSSTATTWSAPGSLTGTGSFINSGTLNKSSGNTSSISLIDASLVSTFTNTGAVSVTNGTLELNISTSSTGPFTVASGKTLRFTGSHTFADTANEIISGAGTVEFSAGTTNVNSTYGPVGSTVVSGATATFTKLATSTGPFSVSAGTLKFSGSHAFTGTDNITSTGTGTVEFLSGTISIGSTYDVSGATTVSGAE